MVLQGSPPLQVAGVNAHRKPWRSGTAGCRGARAANDYAQQVHWRLGLTPSRNGFSKTHPRLLDFNPTIASQLAAAGFDTNVLRRQIALIDSMTRKERRQPATINGSRKRRIARGAGLTIQDVNRLLKQHRQLAKTMKRVSKGGMDKVLAALQRKGP